MIENYDHCLNFEVSDKRITFAGASTPQIVSHNFGCICIHIDFDEQWDDVIKTARFIHDEKFIDVVLTDNECICPKEVISQGRISLGVYGGDLKSTTPVVVEVAESILSLSGEELPEAPTDDVYTQLMSMLSANQVEVDNATQACWDAVTAANNAADSLLQAKDELENGGFIMSIKEHNKGINLSFWVGTQEEFDSQKDGILDSTFCIITDDKTAQEIREQIEGLTADITTLIKSLNLIRNSISTLCEDVVEKDEMAITGEASGTTFDVGTYFKTEDGIAHLCIDIDSPSIPTFSSFATDLGIDAPCQTIYGVVNAIYEQDTKFYTEPVTFIINPDGSVEIPSYVYTAASIYKGIITYVCKSESEEV